MKEDNKLKGQDYLVIMLLVFLLFIGGLFTKAWSQELPEGYFMETLDITELNQPICTKFVKWDNIEYMLIAERAGRVWLYEDVGGVWHENSEPLIDISNQVTVQFERGLQSIVVNGKFVYVYYTVDETYLYGHPSDQSGATINRVSRFEIQYANNNSLPENIILGNWEWNEATQKYDTDGIPSLRGNHQGGGMTYHSGKLYVATGDSSHGDYSQQAADLGIIPQNQVGLNGMYLSQLDNSGNGKILRLSPTTGNGYNTNYNFDVDNPKSWKSRTFAKGFRNPFRIARLKGTASSNVIVADVGAGSREEISEATNGYNGGWGLYEGFREQWYDDTITDPDTGEFLIDNIPLSAKPLIDYAHGTPFTRVLDETGEDGVEFSDNPMAGNSITGGTYISGDNFGEEYQGAYVFSDFTTGWINFAFKTNEYRFSGTENFAANDTVPWCVDITEGRDGALYFTTLFGGIIKIYLDKDTLGTYNFNAKEDKITYYMRTKYLKTTVPLKLFNNLGQQVLYVNKSQQINLPSGVYLAITNNGYSKKIIID